MFESTANKFFENKDLSQYKASIQISLDGFSFIITHETGQAIIAGKNSPVKISSQALAGHHFADWYSSEPVLKLPFQKFEVFIFEELFTLVPAEADEKTAEQINHILLDPGKERTHYTNKTSLDLNVNFAIHSELTTHVKKVFSEVEWIHPVAVLLNHLPDSDKPNLAMLIQTQYQYFLLIRQRNKLLLANCFTARHPNDLIYQVINTFQQLKVSRNLTQLMISGTSENHLKIAELLTPYFPNTTLFPKENEHIKGFNPLHYYLATL